MFNWIYKFRLFKKIHNKLDFQDQYINRIVQDFREEIDILKKVCLQREWKEIAQLSCFYISSGIPSFVEEKMDKEREKLRLEGLSFCYKGKDGKEIWAKF